MLINEITKVLIIVLNIVLIIDSYQFKEKSARNHDKKTFGVYNK